MLSQQLRRAAIAIPSNIAEGYGRQHKKEYHHFLSIAYGSLCELETQFRLAVDLKYLTKSQTSEFLMKEVGGMLFRMLHPIRKTLPAKRDYESI